MAEHSGGPRGSRGGSTDGGQYVTVGVQFAAGLLLFTFAGSWLDRRLGTSPWLLLLGVMLGFGLSTLWIYRKLVIDPRNGGPGEKR
ncbi:MAG TPA: AtpZ/AtpI family protein [Longimicrobium sp.]|nr:AtpZ/AtpI family protein [Longimicrobium sp.]